MSNDDFQTTYNECWSSVVGSVTSMATNLAKLAENSYFNNAIAKKYEVFALKFDKH